MFANDIDVRIGDTAKVVVLAGNVGQLNPNGVWDDITPGTRVEYSIIRSGVESAKALEVFNA